MLPRAVDFYLLEAPRSINRPRRAENAFGSRGRSPSATRASSSRRCATSSRKAISCISEVGNLADQFVRWIDLQHRLGRWHGTARALPTAFRADGPCPLSDATMQTALSVSRSEARTSETSSPSTLLANTEERRDLGIDVGGRFALAFQQRNELEIGGALRHRLERLALIVDTAGHPEAVDVIRQQQHLRCRARGSLPRAAAKSSGAPCRCRRCNRSRSGSGLEISPRSPSANATCR